MKTPNSPIINCHTHIFTSDHVPPYIGKTFLPWPLYFIFSIPFIVKLFRFWIYKIKRWAHLPFFRALAVAWYKTKMFIQRNAVLKIIAFAFSLFICIQVFFILYDWISIFTKPVSGDKTSLINARKWLSENKILLIGEGWGWKVLFVFIVMLFIRTGRNFIWFLLKRFFTFFALLPGPQTLAYLRRYISIGRFAFYKRQSDIFEKLEAQYPAGSKFVVLPMDMEFMEAGKPKADFASQMKELAQIKINHPDSIFPFLFIDPRRIHRDPDFFRYKVNPVSLEIELEDCMVKEYMEVKKFSGFKIYPALGYFPFEEELLPVWKYAIQKNLPIITHCIRGTIFYRGDKKKEWDVHPIFKQSDGRGGHVQMLLPQEKNSDFCNNFTHPLNYICMLKEFFLRQYVSTAKDERIRKMFGYTNIETPLTNTLHELKMCFGHYGGDDEWNNYFEADRDNYSQQVLHNPYGIDFLKNQKGEFSWEKLQQIWNTTDWYSIISSIMLQHPNVYSDISYIIHNPDIWPLLKETLGRDPLPAGSRRLSEAVLFGTDFYVVRNHKSEKQLLADMESNLDAADVDQIARINPVRFIN